LEETLGDKQVDGALTNKQVKDKIEVIKEVKDNLEEEVIKIETIVIIDNKILHHLLNKILHLVQVLGVAQMLQVLLVIKEEVGVKEQVGAKTLEGLD
jgi:hypothetical protein